MFAPHCSRCGRRVLLGTRRILRIHDEPGGTRRVDLRCHCGHQVSERMVTPGARASAVERSGPGGRQTAA